jgi:ribA/ribD-fused uncharacterized protein
MIKQFSGQYSGFSNMAILATPFIYQNIAYNSSENFYQAMKTKDMEVRRYVASLPPRKSKTYMRKLKKQNPKNILSCFDTIKLDVMEYILRFKFNQEPFRSLLLNTGDQEIIEGNYHNDLFWGVDLKDSEEPGANHLGRLIMKLRDELKSHPERQLFNDFTPYKHTFKNGQIFVINRRLEKEDVYIGRGSVFGNANDSKTNEDITFNDSLRLYSHDLKRELNDVNSNCYIQFCHILGWVRNGHDVRLGCYCKSCKTTHPKYATIDCPCHGDIIKAELEKHLV